MIERRSARMKVGSGRSLLVARRSAWTGRRRDDAAATGVGRVALLSLSEQVLHSSSRRSRMMQSHASESLQDLHRDSTCCPSICSQVLTALSINELQLHQRIATASSLLAQGAKGGIPCGGVAIHPRKSNRLRARPEGVEARRERISENTTAVPRAASRAAPAARPAGPRSAAASRPRSGQT